MQSYTNILYIFLRFLISQPAAILQVIAFGAKKKKKRKKKVHFCWEIERWCFCFLLCKGLGDGKE